ncbi:MAG: ribonuclease P protein component [Luminiphilus sp.]|jgi:ribonuclease P protein component|nr:ribonuclease P protein component [Luminiphilus sp.]MDG2493848.1 ribonuclease P protein component [Luminiphilus sp.]
MNGDDQTFPRTARLLCAFDYTAVFETCDLRAGSKHALLLTIPNPSHSRLGLIIAKKNVRLAVQRNRIKRVAREFFRSHPLEHPRDIVLLAKRNLAELNNQQLRVLFSTLWQKIDRAQQQTNHQ